MSVTMFQVDAFTAKPFAGNPAAVCLLKARKPAAWMQAVAAEMNLSETAFLLPEGGAWRLRWFTPAVEVKLCGHATLASAHVLWEAGLLKAAEPARFNTLSGRLTATRRGRWIELDFPAQPVERAIPTAPLARALGVPVVGAWKHGWMNLVLLASEAAVRKATPDLQKLLAVPGGSAIITAAAAKGARAGGAAMDFVSRFFCPSVGVNEDPVTGSAHCILTPFWAARLGKSRLTAFQASARGGLLKVALAGDRVKISGQAVTVLRGDLA